MPVNERERAVEVLGRRGVRADRAQRVREQDYVGGRLRTRVAAHLAVVLWARWEGERARAARRRCPCLGRGPRPSAFCHLVLSSVL